MIQRRIKDIASIAVSNVDKKSAAGDLPVHLCNYVDVYNNERITSDLPFMEATATPDQVRQFHLRAGDVVVTKDSETPDDIAVPAYVAEEMPQVVCGYHLAIVRPRAGTHGRYLFWALSSNHARQQFSAMANGITRFGLRHEALAAARVPLPELPVQRTIADYLDAETARIDALISAKRWMVELLDERHALAFTVAMATFGFTFPATLDPDWINITQPSGWRVMRLSQTLRQLTNGYVGPTRDILRGDGVHYIQSLHIKNGRIDFERRPFFVDADWHRARPRIHLRADDVVIVQTGDIGQVAVVPPGFGEASCHALQIARVKPKVLSGKYLGAYLGSTFGRQSLLCRATGALHPHLEGGIRDIPIAVPPRSVQEFVVREVEKEQEWAEEARSLIERQVELLNEHRQALITAAVTGELEIPQVAA
ncbi:MAG TPA: hypothetical protein VNH82_10440 [Candidatus Dormibacteraeota bacterium]|nr:hypothetical protein [Candidatus Dormibacteraeota bacterium]